MSTRPEQKRCRSRRNYRTENAAGEVTDTVNSHLPALVALPPVRPAQRAPCCAATTIC